MLGVYYRSCRAGADCKDAAVATLGWLSCLGVVSIGSSHAALRLAVHDGAAAPAGPFQAHGKRPLAVAAVVCPLDQSARLMGLRNSRPGATIASGLVEGEWGLVMATPLVSGGVEETAAGICRFAGGALCQSLWLQTGAVPLRPSFPQARVHAICRRRLGGRGLWHQQWQAGVDHDLCACWLPRCSPAAAGSWTKSC